MYAVPSQFLANMKALDRRVYGKVKIDYTDPFIDQSITAVPSSDAHTSYPEQTADVLTNVPVRYLSLDGLWALGGDWGLAPAPDEVDLYQMGWWGADLSTSGGSFSVPQVLAISFSPRAVFSLRVVGDNARNEYPVDFGVILYDKDDVVLYTETVTGNTLMDWNQSIVGVLQVAKMELSITRWSREGCQVKITEFFSSLSETYLDDDIVSLGFVEEREVSAGGPPVGNITANELEIQLVNCNRRFDAGNALSPLYGLVKPNRRVQAWLGDGTSWVPLGVFWTGEWHIPENDVYAKVIARDRLEMLRNTNYSTSTVLENATLYELAEEVLLAAGLKAEDFYIDPALSAYVIPWSYFDSKNSREVLRQIAEACLGQVYCDRDGVLRVEGGS